MCLGCIGWFTIRRCASLLIPTVDPSFISGIEEPESFDTSPISVILNAYTSNCLPTRTRGTQMGNAVPSKQPKGPFCLALVIIGVGIGWLLSAQDIVPRINWVWTLGLAMVGIATFVLSGGIDKLSIVIGPFFLASSVLSFMRQQQRIRFDTEVPIMVILIGVLLLIAQFSFVPLPRWFVPPSGEGKNSGKR